MGHTDAGGNGQVGGTSKLPPKGRFRKRALLYGALTVGTLDLLDALIFFTARGAQPIRIVQAIASGLLGPAAFQGGLRTVILGLCLHYFIAFSIVGTFILASWRWPDLRRRPLLWGPVYGVGVYLVMNLIVVPLSAAIPGRKTLVVIINGLLIHMLGVGLPSALFARAGGDGS
jgi:hypothetical protein